MDSEQSVVALWNELTLESIRAGSAKPTATIDQLFLTHTAIYDAWSAYDDDAYGLYGQFDRPADEHTDANKAEAISYAAYRMLLSLFPDREAEFDEFMVELGYDVSVTSTDPSTAAGLGNAAAAAVMDGRADDGSNRENDYASLGDYEPVNSADPDSSFAPGGEDFNPNRWQPLRVPTGTVLDEDGNPAIDPDDPASFNDQLVLTPHWGEVTPFALESGSAFRPPAPPQLGDFSEYTDGTGKVTTNDAAYREQVTAVLQASADLTDEHKVIAEFWADGPRTESPPGHWNQIAQNIALREGHGIDDDVKMFFALNAAVFDAGVATWESKNAYDYIRPQSAIRDLFYDQEVEAWAGPNRGTDTILGQEWQPYQNTTFVTPPFQEFTSGHSAFSMAAAMTIASYVGSDAFYDGTTRGAYDLDGVGGTDLLGQFIATDLVFENPPDEPVILQWETLSEAAAEAGISRIFGGIHIQDGDLRGRELGREVSDMAEQRWTALFTRGGDDELTASTEGGLLIAGAGDDTVMGGAGADKVESGTGIDTVTLAGGADTLQGTMAELTGDTVTDFTTGDTIRIQDAAIGRSALTDTDTGAALALEGDMALSLNGTFGAGDFMAVQADGDTFITFETFLPTLVEREAVDTDSINGIVNQRFLTGNGSDDFTITIAANSDENAKFDNALGVYEVDGAGAIVNAQLISANVKTDDGTAVQIENVTDGNQLGFFLIQDGAEFADGLASTDSLGFVFDDTGAAHLTVNGSVADVTTLHSFDAAFNDNGLQHVLSGVAPGGEALTLGFEDLTEDSDFDYEDVVITVALEADLLV